MVDLLYVIGCISSFIMGAIIFRKKVRVKVITIPEDFYPILVAHGMPKNYTTAQSVVWLQRRLARRMRIDNPSGN